MRKAKQTEKKAVQMTRQQGYHEGGHGEAYAFQGFTENYLLTSDRKVKLNERFERADGKPLKGYGLEIEVECGSIKNNDILSEVIEKLCVSELPSGLFKYQRDGSLGGYGRSATEAITQVMTKEAVRNNYPGFRHMWEYFEALGISATETGNCGMHVNISNACFGQTEATQAEAIRKLYYIVNHHYTVMCCLFNRRTDCTTYCGQMYADKDYCKTLDLHHMDGSHGNSFNGSHYDAGRIEIRLVGGQKNFACFRNTMEVVFHLVEAVKRLSWTDVDDITKVFKGANAHVIDRCEKAKNEGYLTWSEYDAIRESGTGEVIYR